MDNIEDIKLSLKDIIDKILVWPDSRKIKIILKADSIFDKELLEKYYSYFVKQFNNITDLDIKVSYNINNFNLTKIMLSYWDNILFYINKYYPSLLGWLVFADWEVNDKYLNIYVHDGMGYNILTDKHIDEYIERLIKEELHVDCIVNLLFLERPIEDIQIPADDDIKLINSIMAYNNVHKNFTSEEDNNKVIAGRIINSFPKKICEISQDSGRVVLAGEILEIEQKKLNNGKIMTKFDLTDYTDSISCKYYGSSADNLVNLKVGEWVIVKGDVQFDRYEKDICIIVYDMNRYQHIERTDNAANKRVELHLHTQMSAMDAVCSAEEYIKKAYKWGHKAIAITDHGVVQSYPEAYEVSLKYNMKVIYGIEAYVVDDTSKIIPNADETQLSGEFVVVDIETTGLSSNNDEIIEIGAVIVKNFNVIDRFDTFKLSITDVKPLKGIPANITKLTGISEEMVENAPSLETAIKMFKEFAKNNVIVAHNAGFDISFLRKA
ncbi:MAG: PHP domain-containing protein, partial [Thermoanaerobacteraceae bacterium]|nr:PHP domain-containing protein [Thermoanaerobacteraceae bacterium]